MIIAANSRRTQIRGVLVLASTGPVGLPGVTRSSQTSVPQTQFHPNPQSTTHNVPPSLTPVNPITVLSTQTTPARPRVPGRVSLHMQSYHAQHEKPISRAKATCVQTFEYSLALFELRVFSSFLVTVLLLSWQLVRSWSSSQLPSHLAPSCING